MLKRRCLQYTCKVELHGTAFDNHLLSLSEHLFCDEFLSRKNCVTCIFEWVICKTLAAVLPARAFQSE